MELQFDDSEVFISIQVLDLTYIHVVLEIYWSIYD